MKTTIRVPASTSNLGPAFDCLGLALSVFNEVEIESHSGAGGMTLAVEGLGAGALPDGPDNLIVRSAAYLFALAGQEPPGLHILSRNHFPGQSGMGSSSSAVLLGLLAANRFLASPYEDSSLLDIASGLEGHPDNVTPALMGGLTISVQSEGKVEALKARVHSGWRVGLVVPELDISTRDMRTALREMVHLQDAVFNIQRSLAVVLALENGDQGLLFRAMADRLHQPYRLPLIPGASDALSLAREMGLPAALSGAGPGVAAFSMDAARLEACNSAMSAAFRARGIDSWCWVGGVDTQGAIVETSA